MNFPSQSFTRKIFYFPEALKSAIVTSGNVSNLHFNFLKGRSSKDSNVRINNKLSDVPSLKTPIKDNNEKVSSLYSLSFLSLSVMMKNKRPNKRRKSMVTLL